ncbi:type II toxin-antitoxin system Phd/YefM family antitoxin [Microbacterium sp.]|uniref:type II toxin-antitoxin system Phd/YefM family antitoxin n=1 Tax=Microbacterium sp. TaxID=51671 RepID=UPI0039E32C86
MSVIVNVQEAKTRLSEPLHRAEAGEEIVIARGYGDRTHPADCRARALSMNRC